MEQVAEILKNIFDTLVLSGSLQKFNNLQHYQYTYNSANDDGNMIKLDRKTVHSLSINVEKVNDVGTVCCYNLYIDDVKICYTSNLVLEASTLFDKEILIEVMPNTILTIIKQY